MAQEYPDNPDEAFLRSGNPVFDVDALRPSRPTEPRARGYVWQPAEGPRQFVADGGPLRVWEFPKPKLVYVIGADPSEGLEHGDFTSVHVLDATNRRLVATYHARVDADLLGSDILFHLGHWYNQALVGVESNNHGLTTLSALQECQLPQHVPPAPPPAAVRAEDRADGLAHHHRLQGAGD